MKINFQNKKKLQMMIFVFIAVITLGVGYAAISAINLVVSGNATAAENQENFKVKFTTAAVTTGTGTAVIDSNDPKVAILDVSGFTKVGDTAVATYTVLNDSEGIGASIDLTVTNSNTEYFTVTESVADTELQSGDTTTATITVTMVKTPIENDITTSVTGTLTASPLENDQATGTAGASVQNPTAFAKDSWTTIKANVQSGNISQYNIGDTKSVTIGSNYYTVRLVNKTVGEHCGEEDIEYSQTACGFVVEFAEVVEQKKFNSSSTNVGGWEASNMRTYLNGSFYNNLPSTLQGAINPTRVISGHGRVDIGNFTTTDNIYLLSGVEIYGSDSKDTAANTTHELDYYVGQPTGLIEQGGRIYITYPRTVKKYNGKDNWYWLRSAVFNSDNVFRAAHSSGTSEAGRIATYSSNIGLAPAFRIG